MSIIGLQETRTANVLVDLVKRQEYLQCRPQCVQKDLFENGRRQQGRKVRPIALFRRY